MTTARIIRINDASVIDDVKSFDLIEVLDDEGHRHEVTVESSEDRAPYDAALAAAGHTDVEWAEGTATWTLDAEDVRNPARVAEVFADAEDAAKRGESPTIRYWDAVNDPYNPGWVLRRVWWHVGDQVISYDEVAE